MAYGCGGSGVVVEQLPGQCWIKAVVVAAKFAFTGGNLGLTATSVSRAYHSKPNRYRLVRVCRCRSGDLVLV